MKSAPFDYHLAQDVTDACRALAQAGGEARLLAGGQSLVPLLASRLARVELLVDINRIPALSGVALTGDSLNIGACTRQRTVEQDPAVAAACPLLVKALRHVGHVQTRNRGTIGGSLCQADPAAELPLVATLLDGVVTLQGCTGSRRLAAADFLVAPMTTLLEPDECLTGVTLTRWSEAAIGTAFQEVSMRHGDFAIVAAAAQLALAPDGRCQRARVGLAGVAPTAVRLRAAEERLAGSRLLAAEIDAALDGLDDAIAPEDDVHATAGYRRRVARRLAARTIAEAAAGSRARRPGGAP